MTEGEPRFEKKDKKPFKRAGFQEDGTYIQEISRRSKGPEGEMGWYPPKSGERIITTKRSGSMKVERVVETFEVEGKKYYKAKVELAVNDNTNKNRGD